MSTHRGRFIRDSRLYRSPRRMVSLCLSPPLSFLSLHAISQNLYTNKVSFSSLLGYLT
ncbi:hypothetical protein BDV39DRAFT_165853, partial [Aspergillus sergii]